MDKMEYELILAFDVGCKNGYSTRPVFFCHMGVVKDRNLPGSEILFLEDK